MRWSTHDGHPRSNRSCSIKEYLSLAFQILHQTLNPDPLLAPLIKREGVLDESQKGAKIGHLSFLLRRLVF